MALHNIAGSTAFFRHPPFLVEFVPQIIRVFAVVGGAVMGTVLATAAQGADANAPQLPHIVLVLVDDMGYGDAKCYNSQSRIDTPAINELASQGMRFTDAHAPGPLCHMSRYGLLTGRYPFRTNVNLWPSQPLIDRGQITIASLLKSAGYRTAMVGKWHLGFDEDGYDHPLPGGPVDVGFDEFFGIRASTDIPPYFYIRNDRAVQRPSETIAANQTMGWSPIQGEFWRAGAIAPDLKLDDVLPTLIEETLSVIDRHATQSDSHEPMFLYVALPAPHTPWLPSQEFRAASEVGMYGDFVMMVDAMVGRVVDQLAKQKMDQDTLLIFTSDNGPVWYDSDVERFGHDSCGVLRGMKGDAWEAGHRMPFIVRWPGRVDAGTVSDQMVCFTDVLATFAELIDSTSATNKPSPNALSGLDSVSFLPSLLNRGESGPGGRDTMVLSSGGGAMSVRDQNWKWIDRLGSSGFSDPKTIKPVGGEAESQLYDLATDRSESNNLALQNGDRVLRMKQLLRSVKAGHGPPRSNALPTQ